MLISHIFFLVFNNFNPLVLIFLVFQLLSFSFKIVLITKMCIGPKNVTWHAKRGLSNEISKIDFFGIN